MTSKTAESTPLYPAGTQICYHGFQAKVTEVDGNHRIIEYALLHDGKAKTTERVHIEDIPRYTSAGTPLYQSIHYYLNEIAVFKSKVQSLESQLSKAQHTTAVDEDAIADMKKIADDRMKTINELKERETLQKETIETLQQKLDVALTVPVAESEDASGEVAKLKGRIEAQAKTIAQQILSLEKHDRVVTEKDNEITKLQKKISDMTHDVTKQRFDELRKVQTELNQYKEANDSLVDAVATANAKIRQLEGANCTIQNKIIRSITETDLQQHRREGWNIIHYQFMADNKLNVVMEREVPELPEDEKLEKFAAHIEAITDEEVLQPDPEPINTMVHWNRFPVGTG